MKSKKRLKNNYVDNEKLTKELGEWADRQRVLKIANKPTEQLPEYIARCIMDICHNESFSFNFINYTYREDMVGDAIENVVRYVSNFDRKKSNNAFSYITTIARYAFIRRLKAEERNRIKTIRYAKEKLDTGDYRDALNVNDPDMTDHDISVLEYVQDVIDTFDIKDIPKNIKSKKKTILDELIEKGEEFENSNNI